MEMDDNKRRRNMILYVLIAFVVYLVLSTVLFPNIGHTQQITKTDYSTFVKALDKKSVDKVEYNTDDYSIYYTKKGEDENIAYKTTGVPNDAGFTDRVLESGYLPRSLPRGHRTPCDRCRVRVVRGAEQTGESSSLSGSLAALEPAHQARC